MPVFILLLFVPIAMKNDLFSYLTPILPPDFVSRLLNLNDQGLFLLYPFN